MPPGGALFKGGGGDRTSARLFTFFKLFGLFVGMIEPSGLIRKGVEGDLCSVEKLTACLRFDSADEDTVGGASEEISDAFVTGEQGHGVAVSLAGLDGRKYFVATVSMLARRHMGIEGALPRGAATAEGGLGGGGFGSGAWVEGGGERTRIEGDVDEAFFEGSAGHKSFSCR